MEWANGKQQLRGKLQEEKMSLQGLPDFTGQGAVSSWATNSWNFSVSLMGAGLGSAHPDASLTGATPLAI